MNKISIFLLILLTGLFLLGGCQTQSDNSIKDPLESEKNSNNQEVGVGGNSKTEFLTKYSLEYYGVDTFIYDIVGEETVTKWLEQFESQSNPNGRDRREINKFTIVKELKVPKEDFIAANQGLVYTDEQIEALYSGDQKQINKAFVNEYALLVNGNIYTAEWLLTHSIQDYAKEGITRDILDKYLKKINISVLEKEYQEINDKAKTMKK